eukprot:gene10224-11911_t
MSKHMLTFWACHIALAVSSTLIFSKVLSNVSYNYVTQKYCEGRFEEWDDKITTLPGLYILGALYGHMIASLSDGGMGMCSLTVLRSLNAILISSSYSLFHTILEYNSTPKVATALRSLSFVLHPIYFFFHFLYYTDVPSTLSVLLTYSYAQQGDYTISALIGLGSVMIRQTNIIWVFFIAAISILDIYEKTLPLATRGRRAPKTLVQEMTGFVSYLLGNIQTVLLTMWMYVLVGLSFVVFLYVNQGIVVGDKSNHESSFHVAQILYFMLYTVIFNAPSVLLSKESGPLAFIRSIARNKLLSLAALPLASLFLYKMIEMFTYTHIFILSDNRHYSFYLWNKVFLRYPLSRYMLIPFYIYSIWCIWQSLVVKGQKSKLWCAIYLAFYLVAINAITIYVFIKYPFVYPDGTEGRFFW